MSNLPNIQPYSVNDGQGDDLQNYSYDQNYNLDQTYQDPNLVAGDQFYDQSLSNSGQRASGPPWFLIGIAAAFIGLMLLGFILLFSGGGGTATDQGGGNTAPTPGGPVVIQWWGAFLEPEVVQPLIDEYQQLNPNVTIEYANKWSNQDYDTAAQSYREELNRVIENQDIVELPDIFMVPNTWAGDYESYVQPGNGVVDYTTLQNNFYPAVARDFGNDGATVYGLPLWMDTLAVVYNRDLLNTENVDEPPTTWNRFVTLAEALTIVNDGVIEQNGFGAGATQNTSFWYELVNILMIQNGVQLTNEQNQPIFSSDPDSVDAVRFWQSFVNGENPSWSTNAKNSSAAFLEEDVAMIVAPSWRLREILRINEQFNLNLDIGVAPLPQVEGQAIEFVNWADYFGNMVTANRPNAVQSWQFLNWMSQPEQLLKLSSNLASNAGYFGLVYPRTDMSNELTDSTYLSIYNSSLPFAQTWYAIKGLEVRNLYRDALSRGVNSSNLASLEEDIIELQVLKGIFSTAPQ